MAYKFGIKKVEFRALKTDSFDRRGILAEIRLAEDGSYGWHRLQALTLLWGLTAMLSENYKMRSRGDIEEGPNYFSEGNECWISPEQVTHTIRIIHKYWTDRQVECFKNMLASLAECHEWEVEYK